MAKPTRILAIETSGRDASVALLEGIGGEARLIRQDVLTGNRRTAQTLAPRLSELFHAADWPAKSLELIAVAVGPGSFTGLRIGVTTAKTLAYAVGAQVIGVNTLAVIAAQAPRLAGSLWVVLDAQRQELFAAKFDDDRTMISETHIVAQADCLALLQPGDCLSGPGLRRLQSVLPNGVTVVDESHWQPMASAVGQVGWREFQAGRRDDLWKLVPEYYRPSAAEESRQSKGSGLAF